MSSSDFVQIESGQVVALRYSLAEWTSFLSTYKRLLKREIIKGYRLPDSFINPEKDGETAIIPLADWEAVHAKVDLAEEEDRERQGWLSDLKAPWCPLFGPVPDPDLDPTDEKRLCRSVIFKAREKIWGLFPGLPIYPEDFPNFPKWTEIPPYNRGPVSEDWLYQARSIFENSTSINWVTLQPELGGGWCESMDDYGERRPKRNLSQMIPAALEKAKRYCRRYQTAKGIVNGSSLIPDSHIISVLAIDEARMAFQYFVEDRRVDGLRLLREAEALLARSGPSRSSIPEHGDH